MGARGDAPLVTTDPVALATLAYLGVFTMALAYLLLYAGLRTTTGSAAVVASLLEPVTAAVVAASCWTSASAPPGSSGRCSSWPPWPVWAGGRPGPTSR